MNRRSLIQLPSRDRSPAAWSTNPLTELESRLDGLSFAPTWMSLKFEASLHVAAGMLKMTPSRRIDAEHYRYHGHALHYDWLSYDGRACDCLFVEAHYSREILLQLVAEFLAAHLASAPAGCSLMQSDLDISVYDGMRAVHMENLIWAGPPPSARKR